MSAERPRNRRRPDIARNHRITIENRRFTAVGPNVAISHGAEVIDLSQLVVVGTGGRPQPPGAHI